MTYLKADGDIEREYLRLVASAAIDLQSKQRQDLANRIVKVLADVLGIKVKVKSA